MAKKKGLNININLGNTFEEFKLSNEQVNDMKETVKDAVVIELHRNWQDAAKKGLHQTLNTYLAGLLVVDDGRFRGSIVLTGALPNMLESGCTAFDMKEGFRTSASVKYNKVGGWYLTIPFRFATPGAGGFSSVFAGVLPQEIYDLVKDGTGKQTTPIIGSTGKPPVTDRLKQTNVPAPFNELKTRPRVIAQAVKTVYDEYVNKFSIYAGLQKDTKTYDKATQGSYNTFRRVGENSDPLAFIHTGLTAKNFAEEAKANTDTGTIVDNTVDKLLSEWGF